MWVTRGQRLRGDGVPISNLFLCKLSLEIKLFNWTSKLFLYVQLSEKKLMNDISHVAVQEKRQRRWLTWTCKKQKRQDKQKERKKKKKQNIQIIICNQAIHECIDSSRW